MLQQYIYASKVFKNSNNKNAILSAIQSPINKELVLQLEEYLSDEDRARYLNNEPQENQQSSEFTDFADNEQADTNTPSSSAPSHASRGGGSFTPSKSDLMEDLAREESDMPPMTDTETTSETSESTDNQNVESATVLFTPSINKYRQDSSLLPDVLQGDLNFNNDTSGVARIQFKTTDDAQELWIYYSDDTNLNSKLFSVVQYVEQQYPSTMAFNRMARSDNAVVFDIVEESTPTSETLGDTSNTKN